MAYKPTFVNVAYSAKVLKPIKTTYLKNLEKQEIVQ